MELLASNGCMMTADVEANNPLRRLFGGLVEQVFMVDLGLCDTQLTDYLGELLIEFVHVDRIYRLRTVDHDVIRELSQMEALADLGPDVTEWDRRRLVNKYIGDYTLFWTGVYPEHLRPRHQGGVARLHEYVLQGKRSYGIAGELSPAEAVPPGQVLQALSERFEWCVHGLQLVRASWERLAGAIDPN